MQSRSDNDHLNSVVGAIASKNQHTCLWQRLSSSFQLVNARNVSEEWLGDELKKRSLHLQDNVNDCLICALEKFKGFEPMISEMPVYCSHQLSFEGTHM